MTGSHLDDDALDELLRLNDHRVQKDTLLHLLATCPECGRVGAHLLEAARAGRLPRDYSALEAELERSRAGAPVLLEQVVQLPWRLPDRPPCGRSAKGIPGDPLGYGPVILDLKASLRRGQRRFAEAQELLDRVVTAYRDGDPERRDLHLAGRALIKKAYTYDLERARHDPGLRFGIEGPVGTNQA